MIHHSAWAAVFTEDIERGSAWPVRSTPAWCSVNSGAMSSQAALRRRENSGYGRELSGAGIQEFKNKVRVD
jgi:succinate-semialdehyde dehydrogenase/glutarate-semialdehyde dehydrogenase